MVFRVIYHTLVHVCMGDMFPIYTENKEYIYTHCQRQIRKIDNTDPTDCPYIPKPNLT